MTKQLWQLVHGASKDIQELCKNYNGEVEKLLLEAQGIAMSAVGGLVETTCDATDYGTLLRRCRDRNDITGHSLVRTALLLSTVGA